MTKRINRVLVNILLIFVIVVAIFFVPAANAIGSTNREWHKNLDNAWGALRGVATNGKGQYILVGRDGLIKVSNNGRDWVGTSSGTTIFLQGVAWGNGMYAVVGQNGVILTSTDGYKWSAAYPGINNPQVSAEFCGITWGNGRFVAAGQTGYVLTSSDGKAWTQVELKVPGFYPRSVSFNGSEFMIFDGSSKKWTSKDGISWSQSTFDTKRGIYAAAFNGSRYVYVGAAGTIATSDDGDNLVFRQWKDENALKEITLMDVIWDGKQFITVGRDLSHMVYSSMYFKGIVLTSPDGVNWTQRFEGGWEFNRIFNSGDLSMITGMYGELYISKGGSSWSSVSPKHAVDLKGVAWSGSRLVAVGSRGAVLTSTDGYKWIEQNPGVNVDLNDVVWGKDRFVAVGEFPGTIITSKDGISWTRTYTNQGIHLNGIIWTGQYYLAGGSFGNILYSSDGINWSIKNKDNANDIHGFVKDKDGIIAVGKSRDILTSTNGVQWSSYDAMNLSPDIVLNKVAFNGSKTVAVGNFWGKDYIIRSSRFKNEWEIVLFNQQQLFGGLNSVVWNGNEFAAVGEYGGILTSKDGQSWSRHTVDTKSSLNALTWAGDRYIAVGNGYTVVIKEDESIVKDIPVIGIELDRTKIKLDTGESAQLKATVIPSDATNKVIVWSSSNKKVVTVDSKGRVTAVSPGTAVITVTSSDGSKKAICDVTVTAKEGTAPAPTPAPAPVTTPALKVPGNVTGEFIDNGTKLSLTWDSTSDSEYYIVYRSAKDEESLLKIATVTTTSYTDEDIQPNVSYRYMITAASGNLESERSLYVIVEPAVNGSDNDPTESMSEPAASSADDPFFTEPIVSPTEVQTDESQVAVGRSSILLPVIILLIILATGILLVMVLVLKKR